MLFASGILREVSSESGLEGGGLRFSAIPLLGRLEQKRMDEQRGLSRRRLLQALTAGGQP